MKIDPTTKATTVPEFRMRFLRLYYGATNEHSDDSVPKARRDDFRARVQFNEQFAARWFENTCRSFGSKTGTWDDVPPENRNDALETLGSEIQRHTNRCEYELDLLKIDLEEDAEAAFDREVG